MNLQVKWLQLNYLYHVVFKKQKVSKTNGVPYVSKMAGLLFVIVKLLNYLLSNISYKKTLWSKEHIC